MSIFDERKAFKPFEYPEALTFVDTLQASIWNHKEFNFTKDVQDFKTELSEYEKEVVRRCLLAISQIEISVKTFWADLYKHLPKPEFNSLGTMLAYNELVHEMSYSELLEILGLNGDFEKILQVPEIQGRVDYLQKYIKGSSDGAKENYTLKVALFSAFVENCSLFSQFFIMKSLNKHKGYFKGVDNVISATMLEEDCFIEGTEVLTPNGWMDFRDIKEGDDVYGFRDGELFLDKVLKYHKKEFKGNLIKTGNSRKHVITTPNHDLIQYREKYGYCKVTAKKAKWNRKTYIPNTVIFNGGDIDEVSTSDIAKISESDFANIDISGKSKKWCAFFITELLKINNSSNSYVSSKKSNIDIVQHIAILAGFETRIENSDIYGYKLIFSHKDIILEYAESVIKESVPYDGYVYCTTVLTGGLVVRTNDTVMIAGNCHAKVGAYIINLIRKEFPEWFNEDFERKIIRACKKAYEAELNIVEWIMQGQDMDILNRNTLKEFLKNRFNKSLEEIGVKPIFEVDEDTKEEFAWFEAEIKLDRHVDFFNKRSVAYSRDMESVTPEDLF